MAKVAIVQERTPSPPDTEAIVRSFYKPFSTGDTHFSDTFLADEEWVDTPLGRTSIQPGMSTEATPSVSLDAL